MVRLAKYRPHWRGIFARSGLYHGATGSYDPAFEGHVPESESRLLALTEAMDFSWKAHPIIFHDNPS